METEKERPRSRFWGRRRARSSESVRWSAEVANRQDNATDARTSGKAPSSESARRWREEFPPEDNGGGNDAAIETSLHRTASGVRGQQHSLNGLSVSNHPDQGATAGEPDLVPAYALPMAHEPAQPARSTQQSPGCLRSATVELGHGPVCGRGREIPPPHRPVGMPRHGKRPFPSPGPGRGERRVPRPVPPGPVRPP